jgi:dynein heavy chain
MKDISRLYQGLCMADEKTYDSKEKIVKLWVHESLRIFADGLINVEDKQYVKEQLDRLMQS